jgi:hypothetical protein
MIIRDATWDRDILGLSLLPMNQFFGDLGVASELVCNDFCDNVLSGLSFSILSL